LVVWPKPAYERRRWWVDFVGGSSIPARRVGTQKKGFFSTFSFDQDSVMVGLIFLGVVIILNQNLIIKLLQLTQTTVVPAGIVGTQRPGMAPIHHIPVFWMPAIHAGMTG
jgi:hypothetical protein